MHHTFLPGGVRSKLLEGDEKFTHDLDVLEGAGENDTFCKTLKPVKRWKKWRLRSEVCASKFMHPVGFQIFNHFFERKTHWSIFFSSGSTFCIVYHQDGATLWAHWSRNRWTVLFLFPERSSAKGQVFLFENCHGGHSWKVDGTCLPSLNYSWDLHYFQLGGIPVVS